MGISAQQLIFADNGRGDLILCKVSVQNLHRSGSQYCAGICLFNDNCHSNLGIVIGGEGDKGAIGDFSSGLHRACFTAGFYNTIFKMLGHITLGSQIVHTCQNRIEMLGVNINGVVGLGVGFINQLSVIKASDRFEQMRLIIFTAAGKGGNIVCQLQNGIGLVCLTEGCPRRLILTLFF